jgi:protein-S-isoprenylcysteine O-methyltransferase Ste14
MRKGPNKPTDMRAYRRQTERRLVVAIIFALVLIGSVVIGLVYGWPSVFTGLLCLLPGAGIFLLLWIVLTIIERLSRDL